MHRLSFPESNIEAKDIGEIIHADLYDPMPTKSLGDSRYYLLLKDDFSHYRTVYFIESKTETTVLNLPKESRETMPERSASLTDGQRT